MKIEIDTDRRLIRVGTGILLSFDLFTMLSSPDPSALYRFKRDKHGSVTVERMEGVWERTDKDEAESEETT